MLRNLSTIAIVVLLVFSCHSKIKPTTNQLSVQPPPFTISFISYGAGIDYKQRTKLDSLIASFNKCQLKVEKKSWGKEGEIDYCFEATNQACLDQWKQVVKNEMTIGEQVQLIMNKKCGEGH